MISVLLGVGFIGGTNILTLSFYFGMRFVTGGDPNGRDRELAGSIVIRLASLHALILRPVFAPE